MLKYIVKYFFFKYSRISVDIKKLCEYSHSGYSNEYEDENEIDIYLAGRVQRSYYPYPTYPVDILCHVN